jgi:hypothetical protein
LLASDVRTRERASAAPPPLVSRHVPLPPAMHSAFSVDLSDSTSQAKDASTGRYERPPKILLHEGDTTRAVRVAKSATTRLAERVRSGRGITTPTTSSSKSSSRGRSRHHSDIDSITHRVRTYTSGRAMCSSSPVSRVVRAAASMSSGSAIRAGNSRGSGIVTPVRLPRHHRTPSRRGSPAAGHHAAVESPERTPAPAPAPAPVPAPAPASTAPQRDRSTCPPLMRCRSLDWVSRNSFSAARIVSTVTICRRRRQSQPWQHRGRGGATHTTHHGPAAGTPTTRERRHLHDDIHRRDGGEAPLQAIHERLARALANTVHCLRVRHDDVVVREPNEVDERVHRLAQNARRVARVHRLRANNDASTRARASHVSASHWVATRRAAEQPAAPARGVRSNTAVRARAPG